MVDYTKRPNSGSPSTGRVSLSKVTLTKSEPTVSLRKQGATLSGQMRVNLNWNTRPAGAPADTSVPAAPWRIGIEKKGDVFSLFISENGAPMQQLGQTLTFHMQEPFYAGIGFASHTPDKSDTAVVSDVVLENTAGKVR